MTTEHTVAADVALDYPSWHMTMGEIVLAACRQHSPDLADDFDVWFDCGPLLDWISVEYPQRRYSPGYRVVPTELMNADACRAFGLLAKAGFDGSAFAVGATDPALVRVAANAHDRERDALIISVRRTPAGTWDVTSSALSGDAA
jgi:hypothetical protein